MYKRQAARGAVADHLRRHGFKNFTITSTRAFETIFKISYEIIGEPKISIIIPNKDHVEDLRRCISSIVEKSTWENYEIIVVENNSETKEIFSYYDELQNNPQIRVVTFEGKFNYSKINNFGVSLATGDYVLLLNNDTQVITINWMEAVSYTHLDVYKRQEYNGIENIYLNGTMIGFSEKEIDEKLQDILDFADIGDYVYQPVKTYSSGMFVRLAFAVAINIDPEILIVDEALSVGDVFFQAKCYRKFEEFKKKGKTILFVSHDLSAISKYCDRAILLNQGVKLGEGSVSYTHLPAVLQGRGYLP